MEIREAGLRLLSLGTLREMAAISLSILAAFAVDAGWETRQDRNAEREILGRLRLRPTRCKRCEADVG